MQNINFTSTPLSTPASTVYLALGENIFVKRGGALQIPSMEGDFDMVGTALGGHQPPIMGPDIFLNRDLNQSQDSMSTNPAVQGEGVTGKEQNLEILGLKKELEDATNREALLRHELERERHRRKLAQQEATNAGLEQELQRLRAESEAERVSREAKAREESQRTRKEAEAKAQEASRHKEVADLQAHHEEEMQKLRQELDRERMRAAHEERRGAVASKPVEPAQAGQQARIARWCEEVDRAQGAPMAGRGFFTSLNEVQDALSRGAAQVDQTSGVNILSNIGINDAMIGTVTNQLRGAVPANNSQPMGTLGGTSQPLQGANNMNTPVQNLISGQQQQGVLELAGMAGPVGEGNAVLPPLHQNLATLPLRTTPLEGGVGALVAGNMQDEARTDLAEGESFTSVSTGERQKKSKNRKSGMLAKPTHNIKRPAIWPHFNLQLAYAATPVAFAQLSFEQMVAGEIKTIRDSQDKVEAEGRLKLLSKLALLKARNYPWGKLRDLYAAIMREIEKDEARWDSDWRHIEESVIDPMDRVQVPGQDRGQDNSKKTSKKEEWYCKDFNTENGCPKDSPHEAMVGRPPKKRQVKHMCAVCWNKDKEARKHSEVDR